MTSPLIAYRLFPTRNLRKVNRIENRIACPFTHSTTVLISFYYLLSKQKSLLI